MNLKDKTVCIVDNGLFVSFARNLAKDFGRTLYHKPFQSAFVRTNDLAPGKGFKELEWCEQPLLIADEIDLWVFLDLYQSGLQVYLREHGARVWGAGIGEEMELRRWEFKQYLTKVGLPVQPVEHIKGFDDLRKYLKSVKDKKVFVKTSYVRGDFETFMVEDYKIAEGRLDELEHVLGSAKKKDYEFIVEDEIPDAVEIGYDGIVVDGQFPQLAMQAYEIKDCGMIGTVKQYAALAQPVKEVNSKLATAFKEDKYRGFFSSEIRYTKDKKPYMIDPCCRLGTPSNELLQVLFEDWGTVLWEGAEGRIVTPKKKASFGVAAMIVSEWAVNDWLAIHYPEKLDEAVKLRFHTRKDGLNYIVPQIIGIPDVGCVVGTGETLDAAVKECKSRAEQIKGTQLTVNVEAIDKGLDVIKQGEKFGISF